VVNIEIRRLTVKKISLGALFLASIAAAAWSQGQAPQLLIRAAHCLAVKNNFPRSKATALTFGYLVDEESYPGERVMYVVTYAAPAKSNGSVFAVFLTDHDGREIFNIQNNASFVLSKREPIGVSFVNPPLGGTWTQEHLASAIERIEEQPRFTIPTKDLLASDASTSCESYTDPQPKRQ
jgi:hypothetical protein